MRRKHRRLSTEVELNLAAMLDMAFQLLAFFILTFRPNPVEGQISLRLPPPQPVTQIQAGAAAGANEQNPDLLAGVRTLVITVLGRPDGSIGQIEIGEGPVPDLDQLDARLKTILADPGAPFEQVILQVGGDLYYQQLMRVIDVCTRQKLPSGEKLTKLSFVELPAGERAETNP